MFRELDKCVPVRMQCKIIVRCYISGQGVLFLCSSSTKSDMPECFRSKVSKESASGNKNRMGGN